MQNNTTHSCKKNSQSGGCTTVTSLTFLRYFYVRSLLKSLGWGLAVWTLHFALHNNVNAPQILEFHLPHCRRPRANPFICTVGLCRSVRPLAFLSSLFIEQWPLPMQNMLQRLVHLLTESAFLYTWRYLVPINCPCLRVGDGACRRYPSAIQIAKRQFQITVVPNSFSSAWHCY